MATHESTDFTVSFATVEKALLRMHAVKPQHEDAWRSRINFLRREGVLGERPGSGRRIGYHTADQLPKLLLALELAQSSGRATGCSVADRDQLGQPAAPDF